MNRQVELVLGCVVSVLVSTAAAEPYVVPFGNNLHYALRPLANGVVRVTCCGYDEPEESLLDRYGLVDVIPEANDAKLKWRKLSFRGVGLTISEKRELTFAVKTGKKPRDPDVALLPKTLRAHGAFLG